MELKGIYTADAHRYDDSEALYQRCGKSGVLLPKISLGFWHNFGGVLTLMSEAVRSHIIHLTMVSPIPSLRWLRDCSPTAISMAYLPTAVWQRSIS